SQGNHAICTARAQNANGLALSTKRPNASKEGTACRLIEICSLSPPGDRRWKVLISIHGKRAVGLGPSILRPRGGTLNSDSLCLHQNGPLPAVCARLVRMMAAASPNYIPSWLEIAKKSKFTDLILKDDLPTGEPSCTIGATQARPNLGGSI